MARLSLIALLGLTFSGVAFAGHRKSVTRGTASWSYSDCGNPADTITINSLSVSPNSPSPDQNVMLGINVHTSGVIEEGAYAGVTAEQNSNSLGSETIDLCTAAGKVNAAINCPAPAGDYTLEYPIYLPKITGKYNIHAQGSSAKGEYLFCFDLTFNFP